MRCVPVIAAAFPLSLPGLPALAQQVDTAPVDPATGQAAQCARYKDPTNPIGYVDGVLPGDSAQACIGNGTNIFFISARV